MYVNWSRRELSFKVVYYGPAMSGKTTNLVEIHRRVRAENRSQLVSLNTEADRTLYFDFMQLELNKICGFTPRVQLYTVPGQVQYEVSRRLVLRGADGVVFVADSQLGRLPDNLVSWEDMHRHLRSYNMSLANLPVVIQLNKRDLPSAVGPDQFRRVMGVNGRYPLVEARAVEGVGVLDTLRSIIGCVIGRLQRQLQMAPAEKVA